MKRRRKSLGASNEHHAWASGNADRLFQAAHQSFKEPGKTCKEAFGALVSMVDAAGVQRAQVDSMDQHPVRERDVASKRAAHADRAVYDAETWFRRNCVLSKHLVDRDRK